MIPKRQNQLLHRSFSIGDLGESDLASLAAWMLSCLFMPYTLILLTLTKSRLFRQTEQEHGNSVPLLFDSIKIGCQTPVFPPAAGFLYQPRFYQIVQGSFYRRAGEAQPCGNGVDPWPTGALLVGVVLEVNEYGLCSGTQLTVLIDGIVIGQRITPRQKQEAACPAFLRSWRRSRLAGLPVHPAGCGGYPSVRAFLSAGGVPFQPVPAPSRTFG